MRLAWNLVSRALFQWRDEESSRSFSRMRLQIGRKLLHGGAQYWKLLGRFFPKEVTVFAFVTMTFAYSGAPVNLSCLYRETHACPRRKLGRLPAGYSVGERDSVVRLRTQVGVRLEVTQHLRD